MILGQTGNRFIFRDDPCIPRLIVDLLNLLLIIIACEVAFMIRATSLPYTKPKDLQAGIGSDLFSICKNERGQACIIGNSKEMF